MNLGDVMDAIAAQFIAAQPEPTDPLFNVSVAAYPVESVNPPALVVGYPEDDIEFDIAFNNPTVQMTIPVWAVSSMVNPSQTRDWITDVLGEVVGIKAAVDGNLNGKAQSARVTGCRVEPISIAGVQYVAAKFSVEVIA